MSANASEYNAWMSRIDPGMWVMYAGYSSMETMKPIYTVHQGRRCRPKIPHRQRQRPSAAPVPPAVSGSVRSTVVGFFAELNNRLHEEPGQLQQSLRRGGRQMCGA
jgi:hypothetical protein